MIIKRARFLSDGAIKHYELLKKYCELHKIEVTELNSIRSINTRREFFNYIKVVIQALLNQKSIYAIDCFWIAPFFNVTVVPQNMLVFDFGIARMASPLDRIRYIILRFSQGWSMLVARRVHHISSLSYDKVKYLLPWKKSFVLPLGFDSTQGLSKENLTSLKFVFVSDYRFYKGHKELIQMLRQLRLELPDFKLVLYGDMSKMDSLLKQELTSLGWVELRGYISPICLAEAAETWRLAFFPSKCENSPNVLNEYFEYKVPFLARDIRPINDIVRDDRFLCDFLDYEDFRNKVFELLEMRGVSTLKKINIPSWDEHFESLRFHRVLV